MDSAINEYRKRRADRIEMRSIRPRISANADLPQEITAYRTRRDKRLAERLYKYLNELTDDMRMDAPGDDEQQQNQNSGGSSGGGGSHGNTRLPFGLCKRFGIEIGAGWTPKDAWDALAGKGITAEGAYERLRKGEDPGTPEDTGSEGASATGAESAKAPEPKPSVNVFIGVDDYKVTGARVEDGKYVLTGKVVEGVPEQDLQTFGSKSSLLQFLKEQGVEKFEDPDTGELLNPKEMEIPMDKIKTIKSDYYGGAEYEKLEGRYISWARRGDDPWRLYGEKIEGSGDGVSYAPKRMSETFETKTDMLRYLKEQGVEEFQDPETKEILNPKEMEIPEPVFHRGKTGYTAITLGMRDGMYTIVGTDYDGKKKKIREFGSLKDAQDYLEGYGAKMEAVKLSPALKKREKERLEWLTADKKMWFEDEGKRYGDISIEKTYDGYLLAGETEDGVGIGKRFSTKAELVKFLKDQGVESVREGKEKLNPQDVEIPEAKYTIMRRPFIDAGIEIDSWGEPYLYGIDLDGKKVRLETMYSGTKMADFKEKIAGKYGLQMESLTISDEDRKKIGEIQKEEEETERRKKEFEAKAIEIPGKGRYADPHIEKDRDGEYAICGYGRDGRKRSISYSGDMYDMDHYAGIYGLDINSLIKDDDIRKEYEKYLDSRKDFDLKATEIAGDKYTDISISYDLGEFSIRGRDARGRLKEVSSAESYEDLENVLNQYGFSPTQFPMDDVATQRKERAIKAKNALASGGYYSLGKKDSAYKDIRVEEDDAIDNMWKIIGTDPDGNEHVVESVSSWDDAITKMSDYGVSDYKLKDKTGAEIGKPRYGMHKVMLMRKPGGGYLVFADSKRYGTHAIMYETPKEEEARKWLRDNGVPDGSVKTRGMNPNDDVPRTHTAKSLDNFDNHRMEQIEHYSTVEDLTDSEKQKAAEMLTEMFDKGAYRMRTKGHFEDRFDTHFKNLLETGTSGGSSDKSGRRYTGEKSFGHDHDIKAKDAEKYGFLGLEDDEESYDDDTASWYGDIVYKFKKDAVKDRVTYTFGDTLDAGRPLAGYAGEKPTIEGLSGLEYRGGAAVVRELLKDYDKYKSGGMTFDEFRKRINSRCRDGYVECHYHGMLTMADVDSVTFPKRKFEATFDNMTPEKRKKVLTFLKEHGIKLQYMDGGLRDGYEFLEKKYGGE